MDTEYELLNDSLCKECTYRISRMVEPYTFDDYELDDEIIEQIKEEYGEEIFEEDILLENHFCTAMHSDIDGRVTRCNRFTKIGSKSSRLMNIDRIL